MGTYKFEDELDWSGWRKPHHGKYSEGVSIKFNSFNNSNNF